MPRRPPLPSPNFNARPEGISLLVIHNISLPPGQFGTGKVQFFQNRLDAAEHPYFADIAAMQVSAHFLIERDGAVTQFVSCLSVPGTPANPSSRAVRTATTFPSASSWRALTTSLFRGPVPCSASSRACYPGITRNVSGGTAIAPGRKTDPGPHSIGRAFAPACDKEVDA